MVIGLAGRIGTGKTSVGKAVATRLGCRMTSFSTFLRSEALELGVEPTRKALQDLGTEWIEKGWDRFCTTVLNHVGWKAGEDLVVDGIRHFGAVESLRSLIGSDFFVVFIDPPGKAEWERRLLTKGISSIADLEELESHAAEAETSLVGSVSDLRISGDATIEVSIDLILTASADRRDRKP